MKFCALFVFASVILCSQAKKMTVYAEKWQKGFLYEVTVPNFCIYMPVYVGEMVLSVNTHGHCMVLCDSPNCQERCVKVGPNGKKENGFCLDHGDLNGQDCNFAKKLWSAKLCE